jgi:hypothetical protein
MDNKQIEKSRGNHQALKPLDDEWRLMNVALARLGQVEAKRATLDARRSARLIVGLDLTGSRHAGLRQARLATSAMFATMKAIGAVSVKLAYFRGTDCKAGEWKDDPAVVDRLMLRLSTETGTTQIARLLRLVLSEKEKLSGFVFIGDHCEESEDELAGLAQALGQKGIPIFLFHECADNDATSLQTKPIFKRLTALSNGVYSAFRSDSGAVVRELLSTVAALSAMGHEGLKQVGQPLTAEGRYLQKGLAQLPVPKPLKLLSAPASGTRK